LVFRLAVVAGWGTTRQSEVQANVLQKVYLE
jgi:hypothetical protein